MDSSFHLLGVHYDRWHETKDIWALREDGWSLFGSNENNDDMGRLTEANLQGDINTVLIGTIFFTNEYNMVV